MSVSDNTLNLCLHFDVKDATSKKLMKDKLFDNIVNFLYREARFNNLRRDRHVVGTSSSLMEF